MTVSERFHSDVIRFAIDGIEMIGNNRTGSLIGLDNNGVAFVSEILADKSPEITEGLEPLYQALKTGRFFKGNTEKENRILSAYFHVTDRCNFHCVGCYSYVNERNCKIDLSFEQICYELDELSENGVGLIVISGGEPFIRDDIDQICKYAKSLGMITRIITNGTMPHDRYKKAIPYLNQISVSVDGYNENVSFIRDKGTMPKVIETVKMLKNEGAAVNLVFTLHHLNSSYLNEYRMLAESLGVTHNFSILTTSSDDEALADYVLNKEDFDKVNEYLKQHRAIITDSALESEGLACKTRCAAGKMMVSIAADGTVYPCHMLHVDELKLGNLICTKLRDIVFSESNPFLNLDIHSIEDCKICKYGYLCGGGCRARSYLSRGSIYKNSDICEMSYKDLDKKFTRLKQMYGLEKGESK